MHKPIVVVGSINLDLVARVSRAPVLGETVSGLEFQTFCGGKGGNQAVALARLGAPVVMIGKLGNDIFADQLRGGLEEAGVDTQYVETVSGSSGTALITTTLEGANSIVVIPGANQELVHEDIDRYSEQITSAAMVLAQMEIPKETVLRVGELARSAHVPFLLDPAPASPLSPELLRTVTWLSPNETETRILLRLEPDEIGLESAPEFAAQLRALGASNVVLKLGEQGIYMAGEDVAPVHVDAIPVNAVDTTAAGDAFNGAFAYALALRKMEPVAAAEFACTAAAISVTRAGAQTSMPTLDEAEQLLAKRLDRRDVSPSETPPEAQMANRAPDKS